MNESLTRSISGLVYIVLLIGATLLSPTSFVMLFSIFMLVAVYEFCKLSSLKGVLPYVMAGIGIILFGIFRSSNFYTNLLLNIGALVVSFSLLIELFSVDTPKLKDSTAKYVRLTGYVIIPFLLIIKLPFIDGNAAFTFNPYVIIGMFVLIWANDTFAYIVGKSIGKNKLFERISPKKTIEGFIGGVIFTVAGAYILGLYYTFLTPMQWMAFAAILSIFGTLGDLVESKLKRAAGVKDSGNIMPGHGGILDRLDSVLFAIPFLFLYYQILKYVS
ncbi:phosphatidate cytidylyltransferase [Flavobacterium psychrotrophum]|uniref:phosphatidate cytidylyltransferase n=1 Tax=Flavobacterium psychrotrophum TaxID=2294119 RepID=UPI000E31D06A|nr:phosphatidate cytidylyltransferase [Flavobacterium psychrotrophum]